MSAGRVGKRNADKERHCRVHTTHPHAFRRQLRAAPPTTGFKSLRIPLGGTIGSNAGSTSGLPEHSLWHEGHAATPASSSSHLGDVTERHVFNMGPKLLQTCGVRVISMAFQALQNRRAQPRTFQSAGMEYGSSGASLFSVPTSCKRLVRAPTQHLCSEERLFGTRKAAPAAKKSRAGVTPDAESGRSLPGLLVQP